MAENLAAIGDLVQAGMPVLRVAGAGGETLLRAEIDGVLRGLIRPEFQVHVGMKVGDVDPRARFASTALPSRTKAEPSAAAYWKPSLCWRASRYGPTFEAAAEPILSSRRGSLVQAVSPPLSFIDRPGPMVTLRSGRRRRRPAAPH